MVKAEEKVVCQNGMKREPEFSDGSKRPFYFTKKGKICWRWYVHVLIYIAYPIAIGMGLMDIVWMKIFKKHLFNNKGN